MSNEEICEIKMTEMGRRVEELAEMGDLIKEVKGGLRLMKFILPTVLMALIMFGAHLESQQQSNENKIIKLLTKVELIVRGSK